MGGTVVYDVRVMWSRGEAEFMDLTPYVTRGRWARRLDTWDDAKVNIGPMSQACCSQLAGVRPWLHELWIRQDGETQFIGPITTSAPGTTGQIDASGMARWFDVRFVRDALDTTGAPVATSDVVKFILSSALSPSDPNLANFLDVRECATPMERNINLEGATGGGSGGPPLAWEDHLSDIIGTYMHMSSYGRSLVFWCATNGCLQELAAFGPGDFVSEFPVAFDGEVYTTRAAVYNGEGDVTSAITGFSGGLDPTYGILVERKFLDANVTSVSTAQDGARNRVQKSGLPPLVAGTSVGDSFPLKLRECDGVRSSRMQVGSCASVTLENACQPITAFMRIEEIVGTWGDGKEEVSVTLAEQPSPASL